MIVLFIGSTGMSLDPLNLLTADDPVWGVGHVMSVSKKVTE